jgi:hypothetical protein
MPDLFLICQVSTKPAERGSSFLVGILVQVGGSLPVDGMRPDRAGSG